MMELFGQPNFDFLKWKWHCALLSLLLIGAGAASLVVKGGPRLGIDFRGGTMVYLKFAESPDLERLRTGLAQQNLGSSVIQRYGPPVDNEVIIGTEQVGGEGETLDATRRAIVEVLRATYQTPEGKLDLNGMGADSLQGALLRLDPIGLALQPLEASTRYREIAERITDFRDTERGGLIGSFDELRQLEGVPPVVVNRLEERAFLSPFVVQKTEVVGPRAGRQLRRQALLATSLALAGMLVYIGVRFRQWVYGTAAVVAVFHDVLVTAGFLSLFNYEFNLTIVAALLTLVGYSVNDT
ncbi:MAG: protein translocase subunit SecF, partial [Terriglobia bacterium]